MIKKSWQIIILILSIIFIVKTLILIIDIPKLNILIPLVLLIAKLIIIIKLTTTLISELQSLYLETLAYLYSIGLLQFAKNKKDLVIPKPESALKHLEDSVFSIIFIIITLFLA